MVIAKMTNSLLHRILRIKLCSNGSGSVLSIRNVP